MKRILVTGGNGQLGQEFKKYQNDRDAVWFLKSASELDICNSIAVEQFIKQQKITHLINTAAYTNVEKAEEDAEKAFEVNAEAVKSLAKLAKKYQLVFLHISTDYVFDGTSEMPYVEDAATNPINVYGASKLKGEQEICSVAPGNTAIIRTSWLYGTFGRNFVKTVLNRSKELDELKVVNDQFGALTNAADLAQVIFTILDKLKNSKPEIYHFSNEGTCTWFDVAKEILIYSEEKCNVLPVQTEFYKTKAKRPKFSKLNSNKIQQDFDVQIPGWKESLHDFLEQSSSRF